MEVRVSGHGVDVGGAFRMLATDRLQGLAEKLHSRAVAANVTLQPGPHDNGFVCEIVLPVNGLVMKGSARNSEAGQAFAAAADRIETQLRRYSKRLKDRHSAGSGARGAMPVVEFDAGYTVFQAPEPEQPGDHPVIIAEALADIPDCSVSDAVMMLDLRNTTALLFKNSKSGAMNMVYRREDGNIGWVEPRS
jgi:ribosomal subunit interface protein